MATIDEIVVKINADPSGLEKGLKKSQQSLSTGSKKMLNDIEKLDKSTNNLTDTFKKFGVVVAGVGLAETVRQGLRAADSYNVLQARIKTATRETGDFIRVSEELFKIAQRTGTELETSVSVFQRLSLSAESLGRNNEDILKLVDSVQKLGVVGNTSVGAMQAGLLQLSQGLGAGVFRAEEFNSVLENLPEVAKAIADGMDTNTDSLRRAVLAGNVLSKDVFDALLSQSEQINERFAEIPLSLERGVIIARNNFARFASEVDSSLGATGLLANSLVTVSENLDKINDLITIAAVALGTKFTVNLVSNTAALVANEIALARSNAQAIRTAPAYLGVGAAAQTASVGVSTFNKTLAFLGGPVGVAVTSLASAFILLRDNETKAAKATRIHNERLSESVEIYHKLKTATELQRIELEKRQKILLQDTQAELDNLQVKKAAIQSRLAELSKLRESEARLVDIDKELIDSSDRLSTTQQLASKEYLSLLDALNAINSALDTQTQKTKEVENALEGNTNKTKENNESTKEQSATLDQIIENLKFENSLLQLTEKQKTIEQVKRKAVQAIMKDTNLTHEEVVNLYKKELAEVEKLTGQLADFEEAEQKAADEAKELGKQADIASENIQNNLADSISDVLKNLDDLEGVGKRVFNNIANAGIDAFSQIAAQQIMGGLSGGGGGGGVSIPGIGTTGGGGGLGFGIPGISGAIGAQTAVSLGAGAADIAEFFGAGLGTQIGIEQGVQSALGSFSLASAGAGLVGNLGINALLGNRGIGADIGGGLGGIVGTIVGAGSPIGTFIGSALGNLVGGLFGGRKSVKASEFATAIGGQTTFGSKGLSTEFAEGLSASLSNFLGLVQNVGGIGLQGNLRGGFNSRGGGGFLEFGGTRLTFNPEDAEATQEAFNDLTEALIDAANITDAELSVALKNLELDGLTAADAIREIGIASGTLAEDFDKRLEREILRLTDARSLEIELVKDQTAALRAEAEAIGANVDLVNQFEQLKLEELSIQEDITSAVSETNREAARLSDTFTRLALDLKGAALSLQLGDLSTLSQAEQLDIARAEFTQLSRRAALGDVEAGQALPGAATAFLQESKAFNASSAAFKADFATVQSGLLNAGTVFERQANIQGDIVGAINNGINANSSGQSAISSQIALLNQQIQNLSNIQNELNIKVSS